MKDPLYRNLIVLLFRRNTTYFNTDLAILLLQNRNHTYFSTRIFYRLKTTRIQQHSNRICVETEDFSIKRRITKSMATTAPSKLLVN